LWAKHPCGVPCLWAKHPCGCDRSGRGWGCDHLLTRPGYGRRGKLLGALSSLQAAAPMMPCRLMHLPETDDNHGASESYSEVMIVDRCGVRWRLRSRLAASQSIP
jgi:hypothetical protein